MEFFFFQEVLVRTSARPVEYILDLMENDDEFWLKSLEKDPYFMNSLFLASPSLHETFSKLGNTPKKYKKFQSLKNSLFKYAARISTRSTPFGLFSGCQVLEIRKSELVKLSNLEEFQFHTSLDMEFSVRLASELSRDPKLKKLLIYSPNTSMYQVGSARRFVSYSSSETKNRKYQLISINDEVELTKILKFCQNGRTFQEIQKFLITKGYTEEDVNSYLEDLIENQVIINELEPSSLGKDFEFQILETLLNLRSRCDQEPVKKYLEEKIEILRNIVNNYPKNISEVIHNKEYLKEKVKETFSMLNKLGDFPETTNLLQIDLKTKVNHGSFPPELVEKVKHILPLIQKLRRTDPNPAQGRLKDFKKAFIERYDSRAVPLAEVLDVEAGIGYGSKLKNNSTDNHPLIDNLPRQLKMKTSEEIIWNERIDSFWIELINNSLNENSEKIQLNKRDLNQFEDRPLDYSASFVVKTKILKKKQKDYLQLEFFGGHTATTWLGRFCNGNPKVRDLYNEITKHENEEFNDFAVAEIDHLPQAKLGNVVLRPNNRENVISYVVQDKKTNEGKKKNLSLNDLLVIVENDMIFLKSESTNRFVLPFYSNAFNIGLSDNLPVFQFLADVTREYTNSVGSIDLSYLHRIYHYIPRIEYGDIILRGASWKIKSEVLNYLHSVKQSDLVQEFQKISLKYKIPEFFLYKKGDNELLVKSSNKDSVLAFLSEIPKKGAVQLTEFLLAEFESGVKDKSGQNFNNEVLLFAGSKKEKKNIPRRRKSYTDHTIKEEFRPGSEWIYYKIYLGYKSADLVLNLISEFLSKNKKNFSIEKWFFIRYYDPDFHIRLRIKVKEKNSIAITFQSLGDFFNQIEEKHKIGRILIDTYIRELMRYGYQLIDVFENIFYHDSTLCLKFINYFNNSPDYKSEDLWIGGLLTMDLYCELFLKDEDEILEFLKSSKDRYALEFNANLSTKKTINNRYSEKRDVISSIFLKKDNHELMEIINYKRKVLTPLTNKILENHPDDQKYYLSSVIHMSINRMFRKNQRLYEYVLFDFLHKIRTTKKHLEKDKRLTSMAVNNQLDLI